MTRAPRILLLATLLVAAGCGNKGPLILAPSPSGSPPPDPVMPVEPVTVAPTSAATVAPPEPTAETPAEPPTSSDGTSGTPR